MKNPANFARNGQQIGQFDLDDLEVLIKEAVISPGDHYWQEGMMGWKSVNEELVTRKRLRRVKAFKIGGISIVVLAGLFGTYATVEMIQESNRKRQEELATSQRLAAERARVAEAKARLAEAKEDKETIARYHELQNSIDTDIRNNFAPHYNKYSSVKTYFPKIFAGSYGQATIDQDKLVADGGTKFRNSAAIIFFVSDNGKMELLTSYYNDKWIFHVAVESSNDKGFFKTPNADPDKIIRKTDDGSVSERLVFDSETSAKFLRSLARSKDENPQLNFLDQNGETVGLYLRMGTKYISAVRDTIRLADKFIELSKFKESALSAYRRQAAAGDAEAQYGLSELVDDPEESARWLKASAAQDYWPAVLEYAKSIKETDPQRSAELNKKGLELAKKRGIDLSR
jgi:hypothetical protein